MDRYDSHNQPQAEEVDELLTLLASKYCRPLLWYFQECSEDVASVQEIADEIAPEAYSSPKRVSLVLRHVTLPQLDDARVIDYDPRTNMVRYYGNPDLEGFLDAIRELRQERMKCE